MVAGRGHAPRIHYRAQLRRGQLREDTRFEIRESLGFQPIQRARRITIKVFLKALHLQPEPECMGRKREKRDEHEGVDVFHGQSGRSVHAISSLITVPPNWLSCLKRPAW
jgi:hypothetical protein